MSWEQLRSMRGERFASVEAVVEEVRRRLGDVDVKVSEAPGGYTVIVSKGDSFAVIGVVSSEVRVTGVVLVSPLE